MVSANPHDANQLQQKGCNPGPLTMMANMPVYWTSWKVGHSHLTILVDIHR